MNAKKMMVAKRDLAEDFGESYPKTKEEMTKSFLLQFADYLDAPKEPKRFRSVEAYEAYEDAKYSSEMWNFVEKMNEALIAEKYDKDMKAWGDFLDWVVEIYFPELKVA